MEQLNSTDSITLEAFQAALDTCTKRGIELPETIQAVASDLQRHVKELDQLSERDATFEAFYQAERLAIQNASATRGKRLSSTEAAAPVAANFTPVSVDKTQVSHGERTLGTAQPDRSTQDSQPPSESETPSLQRFVLPDDATADDRQYFQTYIEELEQLNPGWNLIRDRCRPGEHEAYVMIRDDEEYQVHYAAYLTSQIINEFFSELSL